MPKQPIINPSEDWTFVDWVKAAGFREDDNRGINEAAQKFEFKTSGWSSANLSNYKKSGILDTPEVNAVPMVKVLRYKASQGNIPLFHDAKLRDHLRLFLASKALKYPYQPKDEELNQWVNEIKNAMSKDTPIDPAKSLIPNRMRVFGVVVIIGLFLIAVLTASQRISDSHILASTVTSSPVFAPTVTQSRSITINTQWTPIRQIFSGISMVLVPEGCFAMGSNDKEDQNPINKRCFDKPFWIDETEVTVGQYGSPIDPICNKSRKDSSVTVVPPDLDYAMVCITWAQAKSFCESKGKRLPTEAEWEYAARGPSGWRYPWGMDFDVIRTSVIYNTSVPGRPSKVGINQGGRSWVGAYDMSGGVWEWVNSIYKPYPYEGKDGRESSQNVAGPGSKLPYEKRTDDPLTTLRVLRGGSWDNNESKATTTYRGTEMFDYPFNAFGFRCAKDE